ncbi:unnamed protein product [Heterosigma akashiwo]|uniref:V-type proton ATPase subunit E n=1 Tax=Heterosigma akashiwo TaxID=2829 RepID=A0A6V1P8N5_HETAK|mmetsp:Transcript_33361/g.58093  ORF Transcript_33361/g.58093 Transcript_33361/m.58093 type:complete len:220 (+) Transcript_33361:60-719(+)|eukprot:CAMPEP_0194580534 /NCGR_PEP_ID=MMETSP0292-20121207/14262_1 /TAXON_ID=39354 /ORGANISM="Heterosigma akashiwo, Strain CCMP2393" /LENGTH=219 /DNA_ID=CAMNT_0039433905 /DNA_START=83 /DNA_END=742 /DNA_ORIENTATION=+
MENTSSQIRQMVNFILQEAHEKANEIRLKTEHDFNLEKQMLVHNAKLRIQEEYAQKDKDLEVQERIVRSSKIGEARVQKMVARDEVLQGLIETAKSRLNDISQTKHYESLLKNLIVQSLIKIEEDKVILVVREQDVAGVKKCLPAAVADYKAIMDEAGLACSPDVEVNADASRMLPASSAGGVIATARNSRIVLDNTLEARLDLVYTELLPQVRAMLFP